MSIAKIEQLLYQKIGLDVSSVGSRTISHAINKRMRQRKTSSIEHYWQLLKRSTDELKELIDEVVIPETWFFRNIDPFKMLVKYAQQEWLPKASTTPLRILSIPCATGEEPYSISIALIDAGFTPSQFHIDAIDISKRNIEICKTALYLDYSFRGVSNYIRNRFFRKRGHQYQLDILIRATVNFRQASVLDPNIVYTRMPYDVVFCRNLLIYFDSKTQRRARTMLGKLLKNDGILFVGHAETGVFIKDWSPSHRYPKSFALRKSSEKDVACAALKKQTLDKPTIGAVITKTPAPLEQKTRKPLSTIQKTETMTHATGVQASLGEAERLANSGNLVAAEGICLQCLQVDKQNARAYYLLAMVQLATGNPKAALDYLKKVVYLQPQNIEALMFMSTLIAEQGDPESATRYRERAQRARQRHETSVVH